MRRTTQQPEVHHSVQRVILEQEAEEGFTCSTCAVYEMRNDEASGMKCAECHQWFDFCHRCMLERTSRVADMEWLCPACLPSGGRLS